MFKIGTLADWFGVGVIEGIKESQACGASGVQLYGWGELHPDSATSDMLAKVKQTAKDCGQEIVAICGELGGHGLEVPAENPKKLDYLKKTVQMAKMLNCFIITTHIGCIPEDTTSEKYQTLLAACSDIAAYANENGAVIAVETGPEPISRLAAFIRQCGPGIGVNYDPANLVMVTQDDEVSGVYTAGRLIVHTHAKDGVCNAYVGPEKVYQIFAEGGIELLREQNFSTETPLGEGGVRFMPYLKALKDIGYTGYLTIEREVGENAKADIVLAVKFLEKCMSELF